MSKAEYIKHCKAHIAWVQEEIARLEAAPAPRFGDIVEYNGVRRIIVNGSFVTRKRHPNDVDVVVLPDPNSAFALDTTAWPFVQILIAADDDDLERWATSDFGTDRRGRAKGVVEVLL